MAVRPAEPKARVLAGVFPHPDDESLFAGGLLASAARAGATVKLLCLTRGEAGWSRFGERGAELAERRSQELARAAEALGAEPPTLLDFPDGGLARVPTDRLSDAIGQWLTACAAQVVVSFGEDGAYGHADHVTCANQTLAVVQRLAAPPRLLRCAFAPGAFSAVHRNFARFMDAAALPVAAEALGCPPAAGELRLSLDHALVAQKRAAVTAHDSQLPRGDADRMLAPGLLARLCREERYQVSGGVPLADGARGGPFEGLP